MSTSKLNNQRLYYMAGESIAESISMDDKKYSMRFESMADSKERTESQFKKQARVESKPDLHESKVKMLDGEPKALGTPIFDRIKERYEQQNKRVETNADILYDFWMLHRKQATPEQRLKENQKLRTKMNEAENIKPEKQRKLFSRMEFNRYLDYQPRDIYYTLVVESTKYKRDQDIKKQIEEANKKPRPQSAKRVTDQHIIDRLYNPKQPKPSLSPQSRKSQPNPHSPQKPTLKFSQTLINLYRDRIMSNSPMTVDALYNFWVSIPDKQKQQLVFTTSEVRTAVQKYMIQQVQNLMKAHHKKKGFECTEGVTLQKYLREAPREVLDRFEVQIPEKSFSIFLTEFNKFREENLKKEAEKRRKEHERGEEEKRQLMRTTLDRPASATPIDILAQPKANFTQQAIELIKKYPNDKALKLALKTRIRPPARRAEQYGVYQPEEEVKIQGWVKDPNIKGVNPEKIIEKVVLNRTIKSFGDTGHAQSSEAVKKILNQQYLEDSQKWSQKRSDLKKQLKMLAYKQNWCRFGLITFAQQQMSKKSSQLQLMDDNAIIDNIIDYLNKVSESTRKAKLAYLNHDINMQQAKNRFENQKKNVSNKEEEEKKLRKGFYRFLHKYVRKYMSDSEDVEEDRLKFLKHLYEEAKTLHPDYIEKHYPMVESQAHFACPPAFKYEFFKLVKQFNKYSGKRDNKLPKNFIWAPSGRSTQQGFLTCTFNKVVRDYSKNKSVLQQTKRQPNYSPDKSGKLKPSIPVETVWKKDKLDDRLKFLMTYNEAKECTFKPIIHEAP